MNATHLSEAQCETWGLTLALAASALAVISELLGASDCKHNGLVHACLNVLRANAGLAPRD